MPSATSLINPRLESDLPSHNYETIPGNDLRDLICHTPPFANSLNKRARSRLVYDERKPLNTLIKAALFNDSVIETHIFDFNFTQSEFSKKDQSRKNLRLNYKQQSGERPCLFFLPD